MTVPLMLRFSSSARARISLTSCCLNLIVMGTTLRSSAMAHLNQFATIAHYSITEMVMHLVSSPEKGRCEMAVKVRVWIDGKAVELEVPGPLSTKGAKSGKKGAK